MQDVKFLQKYNDVILENFSAVLKQNLLFQTQISFLEEDTKKISDYDELRKDVARLIEENTNYKNQIDNVTVNVERSKDLDNEKNRLQTALNNQYKETSVLLDKVKDLETLIAKKEKYVKQLENMLPNSKKKKLGIEVEETVTPKLDNVPLRVESAGGTF
jgi:1,2-phenylacetyl-CoA epoxidase catalytic subunit